MKHLIKLLALLLSITFLTACGGGGDESALSPASAHKNATATLVQPQSGWWWNPAESGSSYSIELQGNQIFMAAYLYETNGLATWYTSGLTRQSSGAYSGAVQRYSGGQTLLGTYKAPASTTSVVANALLSFNSASTGTLTIAFADGSPDHTITLERFPFSPPAAIAPSNASFENGWWWNEAESGRGYFIEVQGSQAFIASYMFDNTGQPMWYVSAAALQGSQGLSGLLDQYTNGQSLGGGFKAPTKVASSGTMTFNFSNSTTANMVLPNGSSVALKRFIFSTLPTTNIAPVANAGFAQNVVVGSVVTLDGSASTDVNSDPLIYAWTLTSKPAGSAAMLSSSTSVKPTFTADVVGTYAASLVVNDGKVNSTNAATVSITAAAPNELILSRAPASSCYLFNCVDKPLALPYSTSAALSASVTCVGSGCSTSYEIDTFKLRASGQNYTITNLQARNTSSGSSITPFFSGLSNGQTIAAGQTVPFSLQSPFTHGSTVNLIYSFTVQETGATFSYTVQLRTN